MPEQGHVDGGTHGSLMLALMLAARYMETNNMDLLKQGCYIAEALLLIN